MEQYNWHSDMELVLTLSDKAPTPKAVTSPKFYSQYKFIISKYKGRTEIKRFVPSWALDIVCSMLDNDTNVKGYTYQMTYKGNIK